MIPEQLRLELTNRLGSLKNITPVGGGDINQAARIEIDRAAYFVKWNLHPQPRLFEAEARGLKLLAEAQAVRVPQVIATINQPAALVLEWIEVGRHKPDSAEQLGRALAQQHRSTSPTFGLDHDNYIGANPQSNQATESWIDFFRNQRLGVQAQLARERGHLTPDRFQRLDWIMTHLDKWIDSKSSLPSLLHGDLWSGNYLTDIQGQPVLIDPAVYYGDREAEIAFTELFGGFGSRFYAAYDEAWPLRPGYADRRDLYNLYHLLNHLNLFGEGYGGSVDTILYRYSR
ncbi:MAG TPA: fructosamine kinase family protein [Anaerolineae bacterium]|nr:fructosamine kinase family protein [Anaerolineae bacterium]